MISEPLVHFIKYMANGVRAAVCLPIHQTHCVLCQVVSALCCGEQETHSRKTGYLSGIIKERGDSSSFLLVEYSTVSFRGKMLFLYNKADSGYSQSFFQSILPAQCETLSLVKLNLSLKQSYHLEYQCNVHHLRVKFISTY